MNKIASGLLARIQEDTNDYNKKLLTKGIEVLSIELEKSVTEHDALKKLSSGYIDQLTKEEVENASLRKENASLKERDSELLKKLTKEQMAHSLLQNRLARIRTLIRGLLKRRMSKIMREDLQDTYSLTDYS